MREIFALYAGDIFPVFASSSVVAVVVGLNAWHVSSATLSLGQVRVMTRSRTTLGAQIVTGQVVLFRCME